MKKKALVKKLHKPAHPVLSVVGIAAAVIFFLIILAVSIRPSQQTSYQNLSDIPALTSAPSQTTNVSDGQIIPLTPTIVPANQQGWKTFVYPDQSKKFTFDYPETWKISLFENNGYSNNKYKILLSENSSNNCSIAIPGFNGDLPSSVKLVDKENVYGRRKANVRTDYKDNIPYIESITFEDNIRDPFSVIQVNLSPINTIQCQQITDQILSSLKFYY